MSEEQYGLVNETLVKWPGLGVSKYGTSVQAQLIVITVMAHLFPGPEDAGQHDDQVEHKVVKQGQEE